MAGRRSRCCCATRLARCRPGGQGPRRRASFWTLSCQSAMPSNRGRFLETYNKYGPRAARAWVTRQHTLGIGPEDEVAGPPAPRAGLPPENAPARGCPASFSESGITTEAPAICKQTYICIDQADGWVTYVRWTSRPCTQGYFIFLPSGYSRNRQECYCTIGTEMFYYTYIVTALQVALPGIGEDC